jgi:hypothetical protein
MSASSSFDELSALWKNTIQHHNTKMRNCIPPVQMLAGAIYDSLKRPSLGGFKRNILYNNVNHLLQLTAQESVTK